MKKNKLIDFLIIFFGYLFCACFPVDLFVKNNEVILCLIKIILLFIFLVFFFVFKKKTCLKFKQNSFDFKNFLLLLPCFIVCGSNFANFIFNNATFSNSIDETFILYVLLTLITAIDEELIFRYSFENNLVSNNKFKRIIITGAVFGLSHLTVFLSTFNPVSLIIVVYTFGSGILLGFLYEFTNSIYVCFVFHFLFNFINSNLFEKIATCPLNLTYYLSNILVSLIVGIYLLIIYLVVLKNKDYQES